MRRKLLAAYYFKEILLQFPALVKLLYRLLKDARVSKVDKAILGGIIVYVLNPMDLMPDALPVIGQIDDAYLIALGLLRLLGRTDPSVLREHWSGEGDVVSLVNEISLRAVRFLPRRIRLLLMRKVSGFPA